MIDDIIFNSSYFFIDLPVYDSGNIARIEPNTAYFVIRIALPERISLG